MHTDQDTSHATALVSLIGVSRRFGDEHAVSDLSLDLRPGEIHAIIGLNGSGKTTVMRILLGMVAPDAGACTVLGHEVRSAPSSMWRDVGHMIETPFAYPELPVRTNVYAAARLHGLSPSEATRAASAVIERFELRKWIDRPARTLSLGNRQRLGLADATVHEPRLLILDEPTNSLDPAGVVLVRDLLRKAADERGAGVLVSSHHLDEIARIADRITVLHRGRAIGQIDPHGVDLEHHFFAMVYGEEERLTSERA